MSDLIDRAEAYRVLTEYYNHRTNTQHEALKEALDRVPSAEPWDAVKTILNEMERRQEKLYADYCDTTARLKAINKIAESGQTPRQKIDGIKSLTEMEVTKGNEEHAR